MWRHIGDFMRGQLGLWRVRLHHFHYLNICMHILAELKISLRFGAQRRQSNTDSIKACIYRDGLPGHVNRFVGTQENGRVGDLFFRLLAIQRWHHDKPSHSLVCDRSRQHQ